jgi:hypothetical protein
VNNILVGKHLLRMSHGRTKKRWVSKRNVFEWCWLDWVTQCWIQWRQRLKLKTERTRLLASPCQSVRLSAWSTSREVQRICVKIDIGEFCLNLLKHSKFG